MTDRFSSHIGNEGFASLFNSQIHDLIGGQIIDDRGCVIAADIDYRQLVQHVKSRLNVSHFANISSPAILVQTI